MEIKAKHSYFSKYLHRLLVQNVLKCLQKETEDFLPIVPSVAARHIDLLILGYSLHFKSVITLQA